MGKNLRKIIGTGLIASSLTLGAGCSENDLLLIGGGVLKTAAHSNKSELDQDQRVAANIAGDGLYAAYASKSQIEAAREGRTNININNSVNNQVTNIGGEITDVWLEHSIYEGSEKGMNIHAKFRVFNEGYPTKLTAYVHEENGNRLKDSDGNYSAGDGQVCASTRIFTPEDSDYHHEKIFFPYDQFDIAQKGEYALKLDVVLWDKSGTSGKELAKSNWVNFLYNYR
jgi:hypothetical protein